MAKSNKMVPVALDLIEEGRFVKRVDSELQKAYRHLIAHVKEHGVAASKGAKAKVEMEVVFTFAGDTEDHYTIVSSVKKRLPAPPKVLTLAIQTEQGVIAAILNEKATNGFELVTMKPVVHPLWKPWEDLFDGDPLPVAEFAAFVLQNRRTIADGRSLALTLSQVRASVSVEAQRGRGKNAVNGLVITTKITGQGEQRDVVELPDEITVHAPLYVATPVAAIEVDLCIEANTAGEVMVRATAATLEEARVQAFEAMVEVIRAGCKDKGMTLTFGRPAHAAWPYLKELAPSPR